MTSFLFLRPAWLLALIPLALVALWWRRRPPLDTSPWARVVDPPLLEALLEGKGRAPRPWRFWAMAALTLVILAGPSWQRLPPPSFQPQAAPLALVVDLSETLDPQTLEWERATLARLATRWPHRPIALWVFGDRAWRALPPSQDPRLLQRLTSVLAPDLLPRQGRALARALDQVAAAQGPGELLLLTDRSDPQAEAQARRLATQGHRLHLLVPARTPALARLAKAGGGRLATAERLEALTAALTPKEQSLDRGPTQPVAVDGGPWLIPLLLLLLLPHLGRGLPLVALVALLPPRADAGLFANSDQEALRLLRQGRPAAAALGFSDPLWQGIAYYRAGEYAKAAARFAQVPGALGRYNLGNARVRMGDLEGALRAYRQALALDPRLEDARHNLRLVERALAHRAPSRRGVEAKAQGGRNARANGKGPGGDRRRTESPPRDRAAPHPDAPTAAAAADESDRPPAPGGGAPSQKGEPAPPPPSKGQARPPSVVPRRPAVPPPSQPPARAHAPGDGKAETEPQDGAESHRNRAAAPGEGTTTKALPAADLPAEDRRALEVWLDAIDDDPAELLRALFRQQSREGPP